MYINDFKVSWRHDRDTKSTTCLIEKDQELLTEGTAVAYATASFDKTIGRRESLKKALYQGSWEPTKEERTIIWEGVRSEAHINPALKVRMKRDRAIANAVINELKQLGMLVEPNNLEHEEIS